MKPLSLITVFLYLLPFVFCVVTCGSGFEIDFAYNQQQADINKAKKTGSTSVTPALDPNDTLNEKTDSILPDSNDVKIGTVIYSNAGEGASIQQIDTADSFQKNLWRKIIFPTESSLSGVGCIIYFKNPTGQILMGFSVFISFITALLIWIRKIQRLKMPLLLLNLASVFIFITDCIYSQVNILFGTWLLVVSLVIQLYQSYLIGDTNKQLR